MEKFTFTAEIKKTVQPSIPTLLKEYQRSVLFFSLCLLSNVDIQSTNYVYFNFSSFVQDNEMKIHLGELENLCYNSASVFKFSLSKSASQPVPFNSNM